MEVYQELLERVMVKGRNKDDRTGTGTRSVFGEQIQFDLREGFPLLTTKRVHFKSVVGELLWFLHPVTNSNLSNRVLKEVYGVSIWDEWGDDLGNLGPIYGVQWRSWSSYDGDQIDQLKSVINEIKETPDSRRMLVSAWNVGDLKEMALPPCHVMFQFNVTEGELSCHMYQRSADIFLGVPFNIASYALLTRMVAQVTGLTVGDLIISFGDLHLYNNHFDQAEELLQRTPRPLPKLLLSPGINNIDQFTPGDIQLIEYNPHPKIKAEVAV